MTEERTVSPKADYPRRVTRPEAQGFFYRPELDVLRFFAFFAVFLHHALPSAMEVYLANGVPLFVARVLFGIEDAGAYGVDLFFALSSYLITTLLLKEYAKRGQINVRAFYLRRILRIWPLYFVLRAMGVEQEPSLGYMIAFVCVAGNWACAAWGYPQSSISPLWSVSVEEQFYLTWPFIVSRWPKQIKGIAMGLIFVSVLARFVLVFLGVDHGNRVWCNTLARLDPIAAGALLAAHLDGRIPRCTLVGRLVLCGAGLALLTIAGMWGGRSGPEALWTYPSVTLACSALLVAFIGAIMPLRSQVVAALVYLGRISYGLYVFHIAALAVVHVAHPNPVQWVASLAGSITLTVLLAAVSYRFLERPFLALKSRLTYIQSRPN